MTRNLARRARRRAVTVLLTGLVGSTWAPVASAATPTDLFFSEYLEGSSNNKAIEIYNGTGAPVVLDAGPYLLELYINGSTTVGTTIGLTGTIEHGDVFVIAHASAAAAILASADLATAALNFNGNDAIALRKGAVVVDLFGQIGVDPGAGGWGAPGASTFDQTSTRRPTITAGRTANDAFDPAVEWDFFLLDTTEFLGAHAISTTTDDGTVGAVVTVPASAACLELSTTAVDFGTRPLGSVDAPAAPEIAVTNCSGSSETIYARGTDATGTGAQWALTDALASCADTLGLDAYRLRLFAQTATVDLSTVNKSLGVVATGADATHIALMDTACPGSTGAGTVMTLSITFLATVED